MDTVNKEWNIKVDFITFYKFSVTALQQIENKKYASSFKRETVFKYGVAFHEKNCLVKKG